MSFEMELRPLTKEEIALTEKKMDMTLDDIIKMAKGKTAKSKRQRVSNRNQTFSKKVSQDRSVKIRKFMDSRSSVRQGVLAQRRSNFQANQFTLAKDTARRAAFAPISNRSSNHNRQVNMKKLRIGIPSVPRKATNGVFVAKVTSNQKPQTLDSLFANMKEQRTRVQSQGKGNGGRY